MNRSALQASVSAAVGTAVEIKKEPQNMTVEHQAAKSVSAYCNIHSVLLNRMIEHAKSGGCAMMCLVPKEDGSGMFDSLPQLIAYQCKDVYGNVGIVTLDVTYNASTGVFSAHSRRHPGIDFRADGTIVE